MLGEGYTDMKSREMLRKASVLNFPISKYIHTMYTKGFHLLKFHEKKGEEKRRGEEKFGFLSTCLLLCTLHIALNVLPLFILSLLRIFLIFGDLNSLGQYWSDMSQDVSQLEFFSWLDCS